MKNDPILREMLYSEHTRFINGQLVPIENHEELVFLTVETRHVSRLTCDINPALTRTEIVRESLENQVKDISKLEL